MAGTIIERIERRVEAGVPLALDDVGGFACVASNPDAIAASLFAPEIAALVWQHRRRDDDLAHAFFVRLFEKVNHDITFAGLVDALLTADGVPDSLADRCSQILLDRFRDQSQPLLVRAAALRGALALVRDAARRRASLKAALLWLDKNDDASILAHAIRVAGLMASESADHDLLGLLTGLAGHAALRGDAAFEIGMIELGQALAVAASSDCDRRLAQARDQFAVAEQAGASRPDATLLKETTSLLLALREGALSEDIDERVAAIQLAAFAYQAYFAAPDEVVGLQARGYELACWSSLAVRLGHWLGSSAEPAWLDATAVIEQELLSLFDANRSVFGRSTTGGVSALVQPRLVASLGASRTQLYLLRRWLAENGNHMLGRVAKELIDRVETILLPRPPGAPATALAEGPGVTPHTLLATAGLAEEQREQMLSEVIGGAVAISARRTSPKIAGFLQQARTAFAVIDDYHLNRPAQQLFDALILQTLRFLESRLDDSTSADPFVEYLFRTDENDLPLEKHLQQDYLRFLRAGGLGEINELDSVGGGRADVAIKHDGVRIVTELKRELDDTSWYNLLASYGRQTATYQTTNVRLGALLVLDLVPRGGAAPHMDTLCHSAVRDVFGDGPRGIFVARVPGRRIKPHGFSR